MAKNILQRRWNGTSWEEIHPITKADNVIDSDGITVQERLTTDATTSERGMMSAEDKQLSANRDGYGTTGGSATAYTVTLSPAPTLVEGLRVTVKLHTNSGTNPTLNVNGLGAKAIRKANGSAPPSGLLKSGSVYTLVYDGSTAFILQGEGGEYGDAVAANVLAGKTIGTESGLVTGTMVDRAGDTAAVSSAVSGTTLRLRASEGYRDGTNDYVTLTDADFIAANIRDGVNLFGLAGTLIEGKRSAMGTAVAVKTTNHHKISVSGLSFAPSVILAFHVNQSRISMIYRQGATWNGTPINYYWYVFTTGTSFPGTTSQGTGTNQFQLLSDGFNMIVLQDELSIGGGSNVYWLAIE